jgi:hypothetical protein
MPILAQAAAERALEPFKTDFVHIFQSAWEDWRKSPLAPQMQDKRVRANNVWNQLVSHAKRRFDARDGICVETKKPWVGVLIGGNIFVRMKKANQKLLSRNYPTRSALAFVDQTQDIFGEGIARVEMVYLLDDSETEIERIVLVQRHKKSVAWMIDLLGQPPMDQNVFPFAEPPAPDTSGEVAKRIIKPKHKIDNDKQEVSNGGQ